MRRKLAISFTYIFLNNSMHGITYQEVLIFSVLTRSLENYFDLIHLYPEFKSAEFSFICISSHLNYIFMYLPTSSY